MQDRLQGIMAAARHDGLHDNHFKLCRDKCSALACAHARAKVCIISAGRGLKALREAGAKMPAIPHMYTLRHARTSVQAAHRPAGGVLWQSMR